MRHIIRHLMIYSSKRSLHLYILIVILIFFIACSHTQQNICIRDSKKYCMTSDNIYVINWDASYRRGVSCMEGQCWDYAIDEFIKAIKMRYKDQRDARAYGMRFREEYFPHRELGVCYFHIGMILDALDELELSMKQTPSARAKYYLNQTRKAYLLMTSIDTSPPAIDLNIADKRILSNQNPFFLEGIVEDDQYVAAISVDEKPFFIELAEPNISFKQPIYLKEGWNTIEINASDLLDKQTKKNIDICLDQKGPLVIVSPVNPSQMRESGQMLLSLVLYDQSGIVSFKLDQKEIPRIDLDKICLIEQNIFFNVEFESIGFQAEDGAGNITKGKIFLSPNRRRLSNSSSIKLASSEKDLRSFIASIEKKPISFDITYPPKENFPTYYKDIFLEGRIEAQHGISQIKLNNIAIFNSSEIEAIVKDNMQDIVQMLIKQNKDPGKYIKLLSNVIQSHNIYYINQKIALQDEFTNIDLTVSDNSGNFGKKHYSIQKIQKEDILASQQRMIMALLPFDTLSGDEYSFKDYIYNKLIESFITQERFNLVEREKLPWVILEKTIQSGGKIYKEKTAQEIGYITSAEGVICGYIHKREDGVELLARFIEVDTGLIRLVHDVFTPSENIEDLNIITSGLAMKFRDTFPLCSGTITEKKGRNIHVDIGSEKGVFPGMSFNIYRSEQDLLGRAYIREVNVGLSKAEIAKDKNYKSIRAGWSVRTR